jgi:ankyrin repeat protein
LAILARNIEVVNIILEESMNFDGTNSTDLDVKNSAGLTPLSLSMSEELDEVAELLLKSGASVNVTDANGNTLLHLALTG